MSGPAPDATAEVIVEIVGSCLLLRLNRPERGNALVPSMREPVLAAWRQADSDPRIRAVVVTGTGSRHFCTGLDVADAARSGRTTTGVGPVAEEIVWSPLLAGVQVPVIAAVNGTVAGGGLHFVADADIVVAGEHVQFLDTHVSVGMVGGVENVSLTRRMPIGAALRMTLEGRDYRIGAQRAYELGLVDELCPPGSEVDAALRIGERIAQNSPEAVRLSKQAIWESVGLDHHAAAENAWRLVKGHRTHPDFTEGPRAFAERRPPKWTTGPSS